MFNIYYEDGVNPSECVHTCNTLEEAKKWISQELKGYTMVDADHTCSEDVMSSSKTAQYLAFDGEPITINKDGESELAAPVYESCYFYTE